MTDLVVPFLRSGMGDSPEDGGCIMQMIDWIFSGGWTDEPKCVNEFIGGVAIGVNDYVGDEERQKLLDLAPRLMGTRGDPDLYLSNTLARDLATELLTDIREHAPELATQLSEALSDYKCFTTLNWDSVERSPLYDAALSVHMTSLGRTAFRSAGEYAGKYLAIRGNGVADLISLLDEHDRLTGRSQTSEPIDWAPVCKVLADARV